MKPERWQQIDKLVEAALEQEESQRAAFLDQACAGDEALRKEVETLLAAHDQVGNFIEAPALEVAAKGLAEDRTNSLVGQQIGYYKIHSLLGVGGMGEVYRAEDTKLEREVAIKVLPAEFTQDPERLARFQREAKLLASLNHPNIAAIYSLVVSDGLRFLLLELVEGETLAERVTKGALPVEETLEVCRQIAEGVEAAHEKGVIHRDLKPANVKVTPEGKVKILDFGLAKAFETEPPATDISQSPTLTEQMTRAGVILGTAAYMSPEQAKGKSVDKRADVWSFGCVLYELLTGKRAFEGETISETIARVLMGNPDWETLPATTPWRIQDLLRRCLTKDPHDRLDGIANVRIEINLALSEPTTAAPIGATIAIQPPLWRRAIPWSISAMAVVVAGLALWSLTSPTPGSLTEFVITTPPDAPLANSPGNELAISPDGRQVVYVSQREGSTQLYLRSLDNLEITPIRGTEGTQWESFFSPDGRWLAFFADGKLKKVSLMGGAPITLCDARGSGMLSGSWDGEDTIVFSASADTGPSLYRVSASGGEPESLVIPNPQKYPRHPEILPGTKAVIFSVFTVSGGYQIAVLSLETGQQKIVLEGGREARYASTGHLVYEVAETGTLMAVPFDLERLEVTGDSVAILEGVRHSPTASVDYAFSDAGTLVYLPGGMGGLRSLVWVDREGRTRPVMESKRTFVGPRLSPDSESLAVTIAGELNIWIYEFARGILTPLTFATTLNRSPTWTPDGKRLTFSATRDTQAGIFWMQTDGSGEAEQLTTTEGTQIPTSWSPDGVLAYSEGIAGDGDIWVLPLDGERKPQEFLVTEFNERHPMFSPDGRWIAFTSNRSGQDEVYVKAYPSGGGIVPISVEGGTEPVWGHDGKELFYRYGDKMMVVSIETEPPLKAETPRLLFEGSYTSGFAGWASNYDISPDDQRFLMIKLEQAGATQINVVLNWFEELKRLVPTDK